jgi:hypothetical protein
MYSSDNTPIFIFLMFLAVIMVISIGMHEIASAIRSTNEDSPEPEPPPVPEPDLLLRDKLDFDERLGIYPHARSARRAVEESLGVQIWTGESDERTLG